LNAEIHPNKHLQSAWNKYGGENFRLVFLLQCERKSCLENEQKWIDACRPKYNISPIANGGGGPHSAEQKAKQSAAQKGKLFSFERKAQLAIAHKGQIPWNKGGTTSGEVKAKLSAIQKKRMASPELRARISASLIGNIPWNKDKPMSLEQKIKLSIAHKGQVPWNKGKING